MITYEVWDLGRSKWRGEVDSQSDNPEHVEAALMKVARKYLLSRDIDFDGDIFSGTFIVGGFRSVGMYRRKPLAEEILNKGGGK